MCQHRLARPSRSGCTRARARCQPRARAACPPGPTARRRRWRGSPHIAPGAPRAKGHRQRRSDRLHSGAVRIAIFLPDRGPPLLQARRDNPWAEHGAVFKDCQEAPRLDHRRALREARQRAVSQHSSSHRHVKVHEPGHLNRSTAKIGACAAGHYRDDFAAFVDQVGRQIAGGGRSLDVKANEEETP